MISIWKYPLQITDVQTVAMPKGAIILSVAEQRGLLCLWALVNTETKKAPRRIGVFGTGNPAEECLGFTCFLGTVVMSSGFVWHVFDLGKGD